LVNHRTGVSEKYGQQELEVIYMMRADRAPSDEPCGQVAEGHVRIGLDDLKSPIVDFLFELGFDGFGLPAVGSSRRSLVADAVFVEVRPPHVTALK
jgi:hypothetical protein